MTPGALTHGDTMSSRALLSFLCVCSHVTLEGYSHPLPFTFLVLPQLFLSPSVIVAQKKKIAFLAAVRYSDGFCWDMRQWEVFLLHKTAESKNGKDLTLLDFFCLGGMHLLENFPKVTTQFMYPWVWWGSSPVLSTYASPSGTFSLLTSSECLIRGLVP